MQPHLVHFSRPLPVVLPQPEALRVVLRSQIGWGNHQCTIDVQRLQSTHFESGPRHAARGPRRHQNSNYIQTIPSIPNKMPVSYKAPHCRRFFLWMKNTPLRRCAPSPRSTHCFAMRAGGRSPRREAALAWLPLAWAATVLWVACDAERWEKNVL